MPQMTVAEAKAAMIAAGEAPKGFLEREKQLRGRAEISAVPIEVPVEDFAPETVPEVIPTPKVEVREPKEPKEPERIDGDKFSAEIRQENGEWVGEITYKNGAGSEKFRATTKNSLMMKLLEGKGNATLRVKEAVRREKLGRPQPDTGSLLPQPKELTAEDYVRIAKKFETDPEGAKAEIVSATIGLTPEKARARIIDTTEAAQALIFREAHPEFYPTVDNTTAIKAYLAEHKWPVTARNLELALEDMTENDLFPDVRTEIEPEKDSIHTKSRTEAVAPKVEDSTPAVVPAPVSTETPVTTTAPPVRKRGTSGLVPGASSAAPEDGPKQAELSAEELKKLPLAELKRIATADRLKRRSVRG